MRTLNVIEGVEFSLPLPEAQRLRLAAERLRTKLKPRFSILRETAGTFTLSNVVGSIDIGSGLLIQVSPKVSVDYDWTTAVVSLLTGEEAIDVAGERRAGTSNVHTKLLDALARVYLARLEKAFRQEGPIVLMERVSRELPYLHGKLDVSRWARSAAWRPHVFPITRIELARDNPFTRCMTYVAETLAHATNNPMCRNGLRAVVRDLSAGISNSGLASPLLTRQPLPEQWGVYKPAWAMAMSIMNKTSLFGANGNLSGLGLAIEAWPLLETLLERTLKSVQDIGRRSGRQFTYQVQGNVNLLTPEGGASHKSFAPEPDGRLFEDGRLVATFEAKYTKFDEIRPQREHIYQALSTAAACHAPTAVLIYPTAFSPLIWNVSGFHSHPSRLIAIGLDLFKWMPSSQVDTRAQLILNTLSLSVSESDTSFLGTTVT